MNTKARSKLRVGRLRRAAILALLVFCSAGPVKGDLQVSIARPEQTVTARDHVKALLLSDGGSVMLGVGAQVAIAANGRGLTWRSGAIRLSMGQSLVPITLRHGDVQITLISGALVAVQNGSGIRLHLTHDGLADITAGTVSRRLYRAGFAVETRSNGHLTRPRRLDAETRIGDLRAVSPALIGAVSVSDVP